MNEERILSMSAFEAAHLIRSFREKNSDLSTPDLIRMARAIRADFYSHDYEAGSHIEELVAIECCTFPIEEFFAAAVDAIIAHRRPFWTRLAPAGRNHVLQAVGVNGTQCLRASGLLGNSEKATDWWDALASAHRRERDARLLAQGREGERLSLDYERARLSRESIAKEPVWVAIEDNTVGYDILSYGLVDGQEASRLIEVKTTYADRPRMILSRNEWKTAEQFGAAYEFHLWKPSEREPSIFTVDQIRQHIPSDNGRGEWESVEIRPV